jgi:hypothetical protein
MPYLLFLLGCALGVYGLYRFFSRANITQRIVFLRSVFCAGALLLCLFLALTGRVGAAMAIAAAGIPLLAQAFARKENPDFEAAASAPKAGSQQMARKEAFDVLGLKEGASDEDIQKSYKALLKKFHPDHGGNAYMMQKLNEARDVLLKKKG